MDISIYNESIHDIWIYLLINMLPIILGAIALGAIALLALLKKIIKKTTCFLMLILCIALLSYPIIELSIFNYDLQQKCFVVYYGEFDYMQVSGNKKDVFEVLDDSNLYVRSVSNLNINTGTHTGYVLYGKFSHWVIAYSSTPLE